MMLKLCGRLRDGAGYPARAQKQKNQKQKKRRKQEEKRGA